MLHRCPVLASVLPAASWAAVADAEDDWWDAWLDVWALFDPVFRRNYLAERKRDSYELNADQIEIRGGNSFASDTGGD